MPRRARRKSSTGIYHVMVRGLNKMSIFEERREKTRMLNLIRENLSNYDVVIYAYCIMSNHFHLLIKADLEELASYMAKILAAFAKYYNYKHNRVGYVYQGRYKSQCVEDESYFWNCFRYIHTNPSKGKDLKEMLNYTYSSMREFYIGKKDIIKEETQDLLAKRFCSKQEYLEFHKASSWDIFEDVQEEMYEEYVRVAMEMLGQYELKYELPQIEILDYSKTRNNYTKELMKVLKKSKKETEKILEIVREKIKGTG